MMHHVTAHAYVKFQPALRIYFEVQPSSESTPSFFLPPTTILPPSTHLPTHLQSASLPTWQNHHTSAPAAQTASKCGTTPTAARLSPRASATSLRLATATDGMIAAMIVIEIGTGDTGLDPRAEKTEAVGEMIGIGGVVGEAGTSETRIDVEEGERREEVEEIEVSTCKCRDPSAWL